MGDEKFVADNMVDIIRDIVREEVNKTDSTLLCRVKNIYSENAVDVIPVSDKTLILHNIPNMTKYDLSIGDYVYIYKIGNQLDNSFICYVLGKNPVDRSYIVAGTEEGWGIDDFVPQLSYDSKNDILSVSNYTDLVEIVERNGLSLNDLEVGAVIKKHSRSEGSKCDSGRSRRVFPSLNGNKATSWKGMFVDSVEKKFLFSMESDGALKVSVRGSDKVVKESSLKEWLLRISPTGRCSTGNSPNFVGFSYCFLGLKFRINKQETKYSENSLAFSVGNKYLSSDWNL